MAEGTGLGRGSRRGREGGRRPLCYLAASLLWIARCPPPRASGGGAGPGEGSGARGGKPLPLPVARRPPLEGRPPPLGRRGAERAGDAGEGFREGTHSACHPPGPFDPSLPTPSSGGPEGGSVAGICYFPQLNWGSGAVISLHWGRGWGSTPSRASPGNAPTPPTRGGQ